MNKEDYNGRLKLVQSLIRKYGLKTSSVDPLDYDPDCPFPYNNYLYRVQLAAPATAEHFTGQDQPCTAAAPLKGLSTVVVRLSNPRAQGLQQANRVQNEVAALHLARAGMIAVHPAAVSMVPNVYAWKARARTDEPAASASVDTVDADGQDVDYGWLIIDYKMGKPLDKIYKSLAPEAQQSVRIQVAQFIAGLQNLRLAGDGKDPTSLLHSGYLGGMTITSDGSTGCIAPGSMTTLKGGPWKSFAEFLQTRLTEQLREIDEDNGGVIQGWRPNGVRKRLDALVPEMENIVSGIKDTTQRALVHGDLTMNNMLYDENSGIITGIIDFDFAFIGPPVYEYFLSLRDIGGNLPSLFNEIDAGHEISIEDYFSSKATDEAAPSAVQTQLAKSFFQAVQDQKALPPSQIPGVNTLLTLYRLETLICPMRLVHPFFLKKKTKEEIAAARKSTEHKILACLKSLGC